MLVLGVNTSGAACEAALLRGGAVLASRSEGMTSGHDASLAVLVQAVMAEAGIRPAALDRVAVVTGPGSFTGVRVGVALARGLALAIDRPCLGVTSLEALDMGDTGDCLVLGILPARRRAPDRSWWAQLLRGGEGIEPPVEADAQMLARLGQAADVVAGAQGEAMSWDFAVRAGLPTAEHAARLAGRLDPTKRAAARPVYVRPPDAQPMARS